jgi:hypothetical protein
MDGGPQETPMIRRLSAILAAGVLALIVAAPALAGGWADIKADAGTTTEPPVAGQPTVIGFTVLQHGVTPAGWVHPTVTITDPVSGHTETAVARGEGADGHFVATVVLPDSGYWTWTVSLPELIVEAPAVTLAVAAADGTAPAFDPATTMTAIERARRDASQTALDAVTPELQRMDSLLTVQRAQIGELQTTMRGLETQRDDLAARLDALPSAGPSTGNVPILGVVLIAVLAGAAAGFAMVWLAGRPGPREIVSSVEAPRGSSPA